MKILAIRLTNLNSLAGSWEIDLTASDFASAGIFAIVGATGAGKSTILDAVSLALYGRTPRIRQISKSANDLMTHNKGQCSAELEFISARGHFRCHWSQHRARRLPTGELQQPRHEISDAATGKVLETKMKEVARKVVELTGMDFDQFTRSMLLAQGEFNKFLQASADDRAPILEQITGTEIYSRISRQVHELTGRSKQHLDLLRQELSGYKLLSQEEETKITRELQVLAADTAILQKKQQSLQTGRNWLLTLQKLTSTSEALQRELEKLKQEKLEFAPHQQKLAQATAAQQISGSYTQLQESIRQQDKDTKIATDLKQLLEQLTQKISEQKTKTAALEQQYHRAAEEYQKGQLLLREVAQLDQLRNRLAKELREQNQQLQKNQAAITTKRQNIEELQGKRQSAAETAAGARIYLEAHDADRPLHAELSGLRQQIKSLVQAEKDLAALHTAGRQIQDKLSIHKVTANSLKEALAKTASQLHDAGKSLETQQQALELLPSVNQLFTIREKLQEQFRETQDQLKLCQELDSLTSQQKQTETILADGTKAFQEQLKIVAEQTKELHHQQQLIERDEEIVLLATKIKNFEEERQHLQDGSPCPLCGSTSHPYVDAKIAEQGDDPHKRLKAGREKLESYRRQREKTRELVTRIELQNSKHQETLADLLAKIQRGEQQLHEQFTERDPDEPIRDIIAKKAYELQGLLSEQEQKIQRRDKAEQALAITRKHFDDLTREHSKQEQQQENLILQIDHLTAQQRTQAKDLAAKEDAFRGELQNLQHRYPEFGSLEPGVQAIQRVMVTLETKSRVYEENKQKYEQSLEQDKNLQSAVQTSQAAIEELEGATSRLQTKQEELSGELQATTAQRKQLFGEKAVDQEEQRLQQQQGHADRGLRQHLLGLTELEKNQATMSERLKLCEETISSRSVQLQSQRHEFTMLLAKHGFTDEEHYRQALLPEEIYSNLSRQAQELERRISQAQTLFASTSSELEIERKNNLCESSLPELEQQIEANNNELGDKQQQTGALQRSLTDHRQALARFQDRQQHLAHMEKDYEYWWRLHGLIGSADGKKFRNFAQGITFELMIRHANRQLVRMSDRYILARSTGSPLDLQVIDNYQGGETRTTANLSGGESFIVSLALALGLASMAGNNIRVDTLFLDEGFGTLDEDALDIALDTLSSLHQEGKLIGIISHVHLLRERISTQLKLTVGPNGRSSLSGPGVKRI